MPPRKGFGKPKDAKKTIASYHKDASEENIQKVNNIWAVCGNCQPMLLTMIDDGGQIFH